MSTDLERELEDQKRKMQEMEEKMAQMQRQESVANQSGAIPNAAQVAPAPMAQMAPPVTQMPVAQMAPVQATMVMVDHINQLTGYPYQGQELMGYMRMIDGALAISDAGQSFQSFQHTINNMLHFPGGSIGMISVLAAPDMEHNGHWNVAQKVLEEEPIFMEFLISVIKRYDLGMQNQMLPKCAPDNLLNARDRFGYPLFVRACEKGRINIVKLLFEAGVDRTACVAGTNKNAADCAREKNRSQIVSFLSDRNVRGNKGCCVIV